MKWINQNEKNVTTKGVQNYYLIYEYDESKSQDSVFNSWALKIWIAEQMDRLIDERRDRWIDGKMNRWIDEQMDRRTDRQMDRWIDVQMNRWIEGQMTNKKCYIFVFDTLQ